MGRQAARFARRIEGRFGLTVTLVDERLSSREAKANALQQGIAETLPVSRLMTKRRQSSWPLGFTSNSATQRYCLVASLFLERPLPKSRVSRPTSVNIGPLSACQSLDRFVSQSTFARLCPRE